MKNHSFDDLIKQKALDHEAPVPEGTWDAIAPKKKKRRRFLLLWWMTGAIVVSGAVLWQFRGNKNAVANDMAANNEIAAPATSNKETSKQETVNDQTSKSNKTSFETEKGFDKGSENESDKVVVKNDKSNRTENDKDGSRRDIAKQTDSEVKEKEKRKISSSALSESIQQDKSSSSASSLNGKRTATTPALSKLIATPHGVTDLSMNVSDVIKVNDNSITENETLSLNYEPHHEIAVFGPGKDLNSSPADISKQVTPVADSIERMIAVAMKPIKLKSKWTIDVSVMPFLSVQQNQSLLYLTRTNKDGMQESSFKTDKINTHMQSSVAYTIAAHKKINRRLSIGAGLQYAMIKEKVDLIGKETRTTYTEVQRLVNGSGGPQLVLDTVESTSTGTLTIDALNSYRFISIPLSVQYMLMEKRTWSLQVNGGLMMNVSAKYNNSISGKFVRVDDQGAHTSGSRSSIGVDVFTGLRVSRRFASFRLFAEPVLRFNTRRYDLAGMINRKFMHQAGLSFGVSYRFGY